MPFVFGYARGSTLKQVMTLEAQKDKINAYWQNILSTTSGLEWGGMYIDQASAHKINFNARPAGSTLNGRMARGDQIVVCKLDRGFRNLADFALTREGWIARGIVIHIIDFGCDGRTPVGSLMMGIIAALAEYESTLRGERVREVYAWQKRHGLYQQRQPPIGKKYVYVGHYGWQNTADPAKHHKHKPKIMVDDPIQRPQMKEIVRLMDELGWCSEEVRVYFQKNKIRYRYKCGRKKGQEAEWLRCAIEKAYKFEKKYQAEEAAAKNGVAVPSGPAPTIPTSAP